MSDNIYNIDKPMIKDGHWLIFPNTIFSDLTTMDCDDTIEGICYNEKTFDECIDLCEKSPECNFGYYISHLQNNRNICAPIRDLLGNSNPAYRLRSKNMYPELDTTVVKTFINRNKYKFPPPEANTVFFMDNFFIENVETNTRLESSPLLGKSNIVKFEKDGNLQVQLFEIPPNLSAGIQYVKLQYGQKFAFNIPRTTLVMRESDGIVSQMEWVSRSFSLSPDTVFSLYPLMPGKKLGDDVLYSDTFAIHIGPFIIGINTFLHATKYYFESYDNAKSRGHNVTFRFIPQMKGWFCNDNKECTEIPFSKMQIDDKGVGRINELPIGRNPGCWGVCNYKIKGTHILKPLDKYTGKRRKYSIFLFFIISSVALILFGLLRLNTRAHTRAHTRLTGV